MTRLVRRGFALALSLAPGAVCAACQRVPVDRRGGLCSPSCWTMRHPS